jgi:hypothetical protein
MKNYILLIIAILIFAYYASGVAAQEQIIPGTVVIPSA